MINLQKDNINLSSLVIDWYKSQGRKNLPWRSNISPYRVWISEIMLQQTQVKTVIPYYERFLKEFPTLPSFLDATEDEVIALWSGLGFYRRARNIFKAKEIIKTEFKNKFPQKFEDLKLLPGIGESTAGAIMSIAYKKSYPILDANVKRVLSRYSNINEQSNSKRNKQLWEVSRDVTPANNTFEYTQGIMDLGATICKPKDPSCTFCPLNQVCSSAFEIKEPLKAAKALKIKPVKDINFTLAYTKNDFLLFKRNEKTFWDGLWLPSENPRIHKIVKSKSSAQTNIQQKHKLTHLNLNLSINLLRYDKIFKVRTNTEYRWIKKTDIDSFGMPAPIKKIILSL